MTVDAEADAIYDKILEEICTELVFHVEIEDSIRLAVNYPSKKETSHGYDTFSSTTFKEIHECICPICERTVGAIRFAPHLEKCLGMGRVSSRIASRRLANANSGNAAVTKMLLDDASDSLSSQNDAEWTMSRPVRRTDRKRRERPKRSRARLKAKKVNNEFHHQDIGTILNYSDLYTTMSLEARQNLLEHMCGVVSEHTGRLCTRSTRCPKHTQLQRNNLRNILFSESIHSNEHDRIESIEISLKSNESSESSVNTTPMKRSERHYRIK